MVAYLGRFEFAGKRVLDVGAASGALSFYVEGQGAEVVSFDLSEDESWDTVPFANMDVLSSDARWRELIRRINNGYWLSHGALGSQARAVYGRVYEIPVSIGPIDVAVYGSILLHLIHPL